MGAEGEQPRFEFYWRPGCLYCFRLERALARASLEPLRRNIWADDEARAFVRSHNDGNETVPTVVLGDAVLTNPSPRALLALVRREYPSMLGA